MNTEAKWAYLAGLTDGEGHIGLSHKKVRGTQYFALYITIVNTNTTIISWLISEFGGAYYVRKRHKNPIAKTAYAWMPNGKENKESLLRGILPYLIAKKDQAELALKFLELRGKPRFSLRAKMYSQFRVLNRRGVSPETNTPDTLTTPGVKIESHLHGDMQGVLW